MQATIMNIMHKAEDLLLSFYGLRSQLLACQSLVAKEDLLKHITPKEELRALTIFSEEEDNFFIGVYMSDEIINSLEPQDPFFRLNGENIDAFSVLIEELSHFHLICQRLEQGRKLTLLELEWQAEMDKLLFCALLLKEQGEGWAFQELADLFYQKARITHPDATLYKNATNLAKAFWKEFNSTKERPENLQRLQDFMRKNYHRPWHEKFPLRK